MKRNKELDPQKQFSGDLLSIKDKGYPEFASLANPIQLFSCQTRLQESDLSGLQYILIGLLVINDSEDI